MEDLDIELGPEDLVTVVDLKFSPRSKTYAYMTIDDVKVGDTVYIKGKENGFEALNVRDVMIKDLPVPYSKMGWASLKPDSDDEFNKILSDNKILHEIRNHTCLKGRKAELDAMLVGIHKKRMKGMILVGEAGCGKTTLVEAFSEKLNDEFYFATFSVGELVSGTIYRGMLEEKITKLFNSVLEFNRHHDKKIVLFIDEIHMIVSNGGCMEGISIHDMLKTYLTDSDVIVIGATTPREFDETIRHDQALMRRMTPLFIPSLTDDEIMMVLEDFSEHTVKKEYLWMILESSKTIPGFHNPDISIEILDRLMAGRDFLDMPVTENSIIRIINDLKRISFPEMG